MKPNKYGISFRLMGISDCKKLCLCQSLLTNTKNQARFNKSMLHRPPSHLLKRQCCWSQRKVQGEETKAVSAWPTQEFTKFRFSSSSLGDDLNVTRVRYPSSCFMKTLCLESTLHIMLPRPIGPCIRKKGGELGSCPSSSWLGAHNHVLQWWAAGVVIWCWKTQISDDRTRKLGESDISHSTCHLTIQIFLAWLKTKLSATPASSLAWLFCRHVLQQRFRDLNSATSNLLFTSLSFRPDLDP